MNLKIAISLFVVLTAVQAGQFIHLEFFEYCRALGYPVEDHVIPTEDHYNLRFYRLQGKLHLIQPKILTLFKAKK